MYKIRNLNEAELEELILQLPTDLRLSIQDRIDKLPLSLVEDLINRKNISRKAMIRYELPFDRHQLRSLAVEAVYHHLLMHEGIEQSLFDTMLQTNQVDPFLYDLTIGMSEHERELRERISEKLRKDWDFERLALLDQAILLVAAYEILYTDIPKAAAINEAVTIAKKLCDENTPALINGVLDQL